jgi:hypothetical protein
METRIDLKVCEGCGCLWLRVQSETSVYCAQCAVKLREFPAPATRRRRGRPAGRTAPKIWAIAEACGGTL